jgi:hypothetical protein
MIILVSAIFPAVMLMLCGAMLAMWIYVAYRPDKSMERVATKIGFGTLGIYLLWMALITTVQKQLPIANGGQIVAFLGFLIWADQTLVESRIRQRALALLPLTAVTVLNLAGLIMGVKPVMTHDIMSGAWVAFHVTLSLAGAAMILGAGVYGGGYAILHHQIKTKSFGGLFSRLPSMEEIHRLRKLAVYLSWTLISLSLASATIWALLTKSVEALIHSHIREMAILWTVVSMLALTERLRRLNQHRMAILTLLLLAVMTAVMMFSVLSIFAGA